QRAKASHAQPTSMPNSTHRRILLVDDNADLVEVLAAVLIAGGHIVRVAYDGPSGLKVAAEFRPEVVFLDIGLPMLDGYEVARRMRQRPELERTVLIALSGYGEPRDRQQSKEAGFDRHLVKPADLERVDEVLAALPAWPGE